MGDSAASTPGGQDGPPDGEAAPLSLLHASVHSQLRHRFVTGKFMPGSTLSTRGIAQELGVSQTPVREALGRLAAEGAVEIRSKRRIVVPAMTPDRLSDLLRCRELLEPEAAVAAMPYIDAATRRKLEQHDDAMEAALASGDVNGYMESNYHFHFTMYRAQPRRTLTQLIETLWLQFGPFMRVVYGRYGTANLADQHELALAALRDRDPEALGRAITADIRDGMSLIGAGDFRGAPTHEARRSAGS